MRIEKFRVVFIVWSDHIHLEIALERRSVESYLTGKETVLSELLDWVRRNTDLRRHQ